MNLFDDLINNFNQYSSFSVSERGKVLESEFICEGRNIPQATELLKRIAQFPLRDSAKLTLCTITDERVSITNHESNLEELETFLQVISGDDEIQIRIAIDKGIESNTLSIYNFQAFSDAILSRNFTDSMSMFNHLLNNLEYIVFDLYDSNILFSTSTMIFKSSNQANINNTFKRKNRLDSIKQASYFYNFNEYELIPDDFNLISNCEGNPFTELFFRIKTVLSIAFVSNSAVIEKDIIKAQITGQRSVSFSYNLEDHKIVNEELFKIYSWIYTDGNPVDKSIIGRNIISLHCKYTDLIHTDEKTFASIQSNYAIYQKHNATQYIELKNKLAEYITNLISQSGDIIIGIGDRFKNNALAVFTFIFTVILTNIVSKSPLSNIFNKDITVLFYVILSGSIVYLVISAKEVNYKLEKMEQGYTALKNNYIDLLDETDINEIFKNDNVINKSIKEVKDSKRKIIWCWSILILIAFIAIENISTSPLFLPTLKKIITFLTNLI